MKDDAAALEATILDASAMYYKRRDAMTRHQCMSSPDCTLELHARGQSSMQSVYRCRPSQPPCEIGLHQADLVGVGTEGVARSKQVRAGCSGRPGCQFREDQCYCRCHGYGQTKVPDGAETPRCMCECAGGRPQACLPDGSE